MSERTEAPTPRRLAEARRRGEVACSRSLTGALALGAGGLVVAATGDDLLGGLAGVVRGGLASALQATRPLDGALLDAAAEGARLSALPALAAMGGAALAGLAQTGGLLAPGAAAPRLERLNPARGLTTLLTRERVALTALGLLQAGLAVALALAWLRDAAAALAALPAAAAPAGPLAGLAGLLGPLALRLLVALVACGLADLLLARWRHRRRLRMTRVEVRREQRDDEGDPRHRADRRRRHRALLEAGPVSGATCLVVNPTRLAVALQHRRGGAEAPRVVAKGAGAAARRLRREARRAGVPVVRDVALARALHRLVEVGDEIPEPLYEAAAALLAHLYRGAPAEGP